MLPLTLFLLWAPSVPLWDVNVIYRDTSLIVSIVVNRPVTITDVCSQSDYEIPIIFNFQILIKDKESNNILKL